VGRELAVGDVHALWACGWWSGWKVSNLVVGGICLLCVFFGAFMRPLEEVSVPRSRIKKRIRMKVVLTLKIEGQEEKGDYLREGCPPIE
jgi:hypothetical protein